MRNEVVKERLSFADLPGLMAEMSGDEKHDHSAASTLDVLWVLYDQVLRISPDSVADDDRDRFLLSKGHAPKAFYAVLAAKGFIDVAELPGFGTFGSILGHHPDRNLIAGVEIASGSLGHGLPIGVGVALGLRARGQLAMPTVSLNCHARFDEPKLIIHQRNRRRNVRWRKRGVKSLHELKHGIPRSESQPMSKP